MDPRYEADAHAMFKAADGLMMCEAHPGFEWGQCPGGPDCLGPGMPWTLTGRTLIEDVIRAHMDRG